MNRIISHIGKYRNYYMTVILIALLAIFILCFYQSFGEHLFEREFEQKKKIVIEGKKN